MAQLLRPGGDTPDVAPDGDLLFAFKLGSGCGCGRQPQDNESADGWLIYVPNDDAGQPNDDAGQIVCPNCAKALSV